ncbi:MAG: D-alanyl-D-alanine carboxypeptidase [Acidobacteria bacterium]|nr:D-alanyl-D-alanine carboxypeptidase [Acidobacteriota bacterium]
MLSSRRRRTLGGILAVALTALGAQPLDAAGATRARTAKAGAATQRTPAPVARTAARKPVAAAAATAKPRTSSAARRRAIARTRAAARAREARELNTPRFKLDDSGREVPAPRAAAAIIYDPETNEVLFEEHALEPRSIASITKVMTAVVFLESLIDPAEVVKVERADVARASTTYLRAGYSVSVDELLHLLLIGSDNAAARVLARVSPYGSDGFIVRMNEKARELGLEQTHYEDPSGLFAGNVSTAYEMARLISYAVADERIGSVMRKAGFDFTPIKRNVHVNSTNRFVRSGELDVVGGKTGFISSSGYCLATLVRLPQSGRQVAMVVLGARSNAARFAETRHLFNWVNTGAVTAAGPDAGQQ